MTGAARRLFVALDTPAPAAALALVPRLRDHVGGFKVGLELFSSAGPQVVRDVRDAGGEVFLDLKLHDIPNTVDGAVAAAASLGVACFTVHALGGEAMVRRAVEAASRAAMRGGGRPPDVLAVTLLTSLGAEDLAPLGLAGSPDEVVRRLAALARRAGAAGAVCSAREITSVRELWPEARLFVPGIRPAGGPPHDQARTATPGEAIARGADVLVVGRPITAADDPARAAREIVREIEEAAG